MNPFSSVVIAPHWQSTYRFARILLYIVTSIIIVAFSLRVLFPTLTFSFDFRAPDSSKNNLLHPRSPEHVTRKNGQLEKNGTLIADVGVVGNFSTALISFSLEKKSAIPDSDNPFNVSLYRSYRGFFLPHGMSIQSFPKEILYYSDTAYYALRDNTLYPFISENAYLSRYPKHFATEVSPSFLASYPRSEEWIGFRVGSLVSFADGVFVIVSETEMRPIGSADIFLALGYDFKNVIPSSEEEIGIYKRGKIFLLGDIHPDGTLFFDQETKTYFLVDHNTKRSLIDTTYRDFLLSKQSPINASSRMSTVATTCLPTRSFFGRSFSCHASLEALRDAPGNDFEIHITNTSSALDINTLSLSFVTNKNKENMLFVLSQIKERLLARFGLTSSQSERL
ncbi:MAG: hypothetical protein HYV45_01575 [Candidatus Moranbacteria bacterium]|nr:hypothetical protein [Candidatus Moranbacteria bacterium]